MCSWQKASGPGVLGERRATMTRACDKDHGEITGDDEPIKMDVNEVEPPAWYPNGRAAATLCAPAATVLEQRIIEKIDLPDGKIIGGPPVCVQSAELFGG